MSAKAQSNHIEWSMADNRAGTKKKNVIKFQMSLKLFFGKKSGGLNVSFWHLEQKCKIKLVSVSLSYHVIPQTHCFTHITHHRAFTITLGLTYGYKFGLLEQWDIFSFCQMSLWLCLKNHLVLLHFKPFLKVIKRKTYFWTKIKKKTF